MNEQIKAGFTYTVEVLDHHGEVVDTEVVANIMPDEGITHVLNTVLKGGSPVGTWYVGLYEGNYTPAGTETAATLNSAATESTAYDETARIAFVPGSITDGNVDNSASKAEFTFNTAKVIYGGFIASASAKGSTSGVLLSIVRFGSPKSLDDGGILRVTAGFTMASA